MKLYLADKIAHVKIEVYFAYDEIENHVYFGATLSIEMGMTAMSDRGFFTAPMTLKKITAKINGMTGDVF